ncbi:MAG TPA: DUF397 domain-containing protein [Actinophytocola sp.]|uniref:DUF397 domain-containing protein n=1 Tax=Actinophytocola sp. TaxID=1872138 RepID=UPI002DDD47A3|nr:DUF397 domain-containing protein [Actinophytocola sp.]HEV2781027.1 DUF397 domain-containing protein [Actinophytocola sp.]
MGRITKIIALLAPMWAPSEGQTDLMVEIIMRPREIHSPRIVWRKSSFSSSHSGQCIEIACVADSTLLRDSKNQTGPRLSFSSDSWREFLTSTKSAY